MSLLEVTKEFPIEGCLLSGKKSRINQNSGNNEWYTPRYIIEAARETMGSIDLDPASSVIANQTVQAKHFYTKEDDGLKQPWYGNVWLNPPYSRTLIPQFSLAVINKRQDYNQAIVLVNNATETIWCQNLLGACTACCFFDSRIKFLCVNGKTGGSSMQGQIVLYFGINHQKFVENFSPYGPIIMPFNE